MQNDNSIFDYKNVDFIQNIFETHFKTRVFVYKIFRLLEKSVREWVWPDLGLSKL